MGGGPKTTTTSTNTGSFANQQQGSSQYQNTSGSQGEQQARTSQTQTTTPNLPSWYNPLLAGVAGGYQGLNQQLSNLTQRPLYGAPQLANFNQQLNTQTSQAQKDILSQLASRGALNSGRAAQVATGLDLGKIAQLGNYTAQIPQLNAQFLQSVLGQQGNLLANAGNIRPIYGTTTTGNTLSDVLSQLLQTSAGTSQQSQASSGTSSSEGTQTTQQSGGFLNSLLGGLLGAGTGLLTGGLSNMLGGGSFFGGGGGSPASVAPSFNPASLAPSSPPTLYQPTSYGAQVPNAGSIFNQLYGPPTGPSWG